MWTCKNCGEVCEDTFDSCWKCGTENEEVVLKEKEFDLETENDETEIFDNNSNNTGREKNNKTIITLLIIIIFLLTFIAWQSVRKDSLNFVRKMFSLLAKPSDKEVKNFFELRYGGKNQILSFYKVNSEMRDVNLYQFDFESAIIPQGGGLNFNCQKDEKTLISGTIYFTKSQDGWRGDIFSIDFRECTTGAIRVR